MYYGAGAVFEDRDALLAFLRSEDTTSPLVLSIVADMFRAAGLAHGAGLDFGGVDALGYRLAFVAGAGAFAGLTGDAILNLASGEFSFFGSAEIGLLAGESAQVVGGLTLLENLSSNGDYRGPFQAVGVVGATLWV
jgi:hypothetical protein